MAGEIGKFALLLTADAGGFVAGTKQAEKAAGAMEKGVGASFTNMAKVAVSAFAAVGIASFANSAVKAASDMGESLNKSNTVFKDSAKEIEAWASTAANKIGLSKTAALSAAGSFGNMFVQLGIGTGQAAKMSQGITELAADFASFHNADISEVIAAQSAAFRGEYDSLQKFLPLINAASVEQKALEMTGKAATKELTAQEKALAVHALMLAGAGDALGDFAKTGDSMANAQRRISAGWDNIVSTIGGALLPAIEPLISAFANGLPVAMDLASKGIGAVASTVSALISGKGFDTLYESLDKAFGSETTGMLARFIDPIARVRVAVGEMVTGVLGDTGEAGPKLIERLGKWVDAFIDWVPEATRQLLPRLSQLFNASLEWIRTQSAPLAEKLLAEWVPAFLVWAVKAGYRLVTETLPQMIKDIGTWAITEGVPKLIEAVATLGGAIVSGIVKGIGNLGGQIWDALMAWVPSWDTMKAKALGAFSGGGASGVGADAFDVQDFRRGINSFGGATSSLSGRNVIAEGAAGKFVDGIGLVNHGDFQTGELQAARISNVLAQRERDQRARRRERRAYGSMRDSLARELGSYEAADQALGSRGSLAAGDVVINLDGREIARSSSFNLRRRANVLARVRA